MTTYSTPYADRTPRAPGPPAPAHAARPLPHRIPRDDPRDGRRHGGVRCHLGRRLAGPDRPPGRHGPDHGLRHDASAWRPGCGCEGMHPGTSRRCPPSWSCRSSSCWCPTGSASFPATCCSRGATSRCSRSWPPTWRGVRTPRAPPAPAPRTVSRPARGLPVVSAVLLVGGAALAVVAGLLHPHDEPPNSHEAVFAEYAHSADWVWVHDLQFLSAAVVVAGLLTLGRALQRVGRSPALVRVGDAAAAATVALIAVNMAVDGVALKRAVDAWAGADPGGPGVPVRRRGGGALAGVGRELVLHHPARGHPADVRCRPAAPGAPRHPCPPGRCHRDPGGRPPGRQRPGRRRARLRTDRPSSRRHRSLRRHGAGHPGPGPSSRQEHCVP